MSSPRECRSPCLKCAKTNLPATMEHDCMACVPEERNRSSLWFSKAASWRVGEKSILTIFSMSVCYFIPPVLRLRVGGKPRWHNSTSWVCGSCVNLQMAKLVPWVSHCVPCTPSLPLMCCSLGGDCRSQHRSANTAGRCMVLPLLLWPAGLREKGTQSKEQLPENWEGRQKKFLSS